jgi:DNA-binding MarR family transcriptional regulator
MGRPATPSSTAPGREPASIADVQQFRHLVTLTEHSVRRRLAAIAAQEGLSVARWDVLYLVGEDAGRTMSELADYTLLPAATVTRLVDGMVRDGLVRKETDPSDRRRTLVRLTADGAARSRRVARRIERRRHAILDAAEAAGLAALAQRLYPADDDTPPGRAARVAG